MKAKFGAIVVDGRGKINGHVASKNRSGSYFRGKVTPINLRSPAQMSVRGSLSSISKAWSTLSDAQRAEWSGAVSSFKKTNIFGDLINPSGFNLYVKINQNAVLGGASMVDTPPIPVDLGSVVIGDLVADNSANTLIASLGSTGTNPSEVFVYATPAMNPGISFVKNKLRFLGAITWSNTLDISALYLARLGSIGAVGQKIHVSIAPSLATSGLVGVPVSFSTIIVA